MKIKNIIWKGGTCPSGTKCESIVDGDKVTTRIVLDYENSGNSIYGLKLELEGKFLTKEQLTYLHSVDAVKEQIEEWFPELKKPSLEVGKWYKFKKGSLAFYKGINIESYGIHCIGNEWISDCRWFFDFNDFEGLTLATDKEVEEALTKEAVKRGFKDGCTLKGVQSKNKWTVSGNVKFEFDERLNTLELWSDFAETKEDGYKDKSRGKNVIFENGNWATIIENTLPADIEQLSLKYGKKELIKILSDDNTATISFQQ